MMVETILESTQDFGMSNGALPQWKRELLQRRAARSRPSAPPALPPPPPPPPPNDDDEELHYGPGIVNRLKSRYLSLALRDAPRRRPSVLRRATSLEHLLDERPPSAPHSRPPCALARPPRPASLAAPPARPGALHHAPRREFVKRARSVDALSRLEAREEPQPPSPSPPPPPPPAPAPRPPQLRAARPPRRPTPLLRETERPPPDVVRSTLRKFESAPTRRAAPAARISAVLRGLEVGPRGSTPEPRDAPEPARSPSPLATPDPASAGVDERDGTASSGEARPVSRTALEGIARAGSTMRYAFEAPLGGSHLPPLAATNQVLVGRARRVGVIRPMPTLERAPPSPPPDEVSEKIVTPPPARLASPSPSEPEPVPLPRVERRDAPPSALVEPIPRTPEPVSSRLESPRSTTPVERAPTPEPKLAPDLKPTLEPKLTSEPKLTPGPKLTLEPKLTPEPKSNPEPKLTPEPKSTPEPKPIPEPTPILYAIAELKTIVEPKPEVEPVIVPKLTVESKSAPKAASVSMPKSPPRTDLTSTPKLIPTVESKTSLEVVPKPGHEAGTTPLLNGHIVPESKVSSVISRIGAAGIERAWSGSADRKPAAPGVESAASPAGPVAGGAWARGSPGARRGRAPPPAAANSVVFNFSNRKEVPDYIENDGLILRASKRNRYKAGEAGVVVLRGGEARSESPSEGDVEVDGEGEGEGEEEPDACLRVRFLNDNVLINGRSSMPARPDRDRIAKLKLQFDDSLTRTFEYPSENSLCEESPASIPAVPASTPGPHQLAEPAVMAPLAANTHIASAALSEYTPTKTHAAAFQLGLTSHQHYHTHAHAHADTSSNHHGEEHNSQSGETHEHEDGNAGERRGDGVEEAGEREGEMDLGACAAGVARSWTEARTHRTDLLF